MSWIEIEKSSNGEIDDNLNKSLFDGDKCVEFMGVNGNIFYAEVKEGKIWMDSSDAPEKSAAIKWRLR